MPHVISIAGAKGGTGKTTMAFNLAAILSRVGRKTVLLDLDPSGDAAVAADVIADDVDLSDSTRFTFVPAEGGNESDISLSDSGVLRIQWADGEERHEAPPSRWAPKHPPRPGEPRLSPRVPNLSVVPMEGDSSDGSETSAEETYAITHQLRRNFDLTVIDCPARWCPATRAAIRESDLVLIPVELPLDPLSARAARRVARRITVLSQQPRPFGALSDRGSPEPLLRGVGWSMSLPARGGTGGQRGNGKSAGEPLRMLKSVVPRDATVPEAFSHGRPLLDHDPGARATHGFIEVAREVLELLDSLGRNDAGEATS